MGVFFSSIQGILIIIGLIAVGYGLSYLGWFSESSSRLIAKLVTQVALPTYMISTITKDFTAAKLIKLLPDLAIPSPFYDNSNFCFYYLDQSSKN